MQEFIRLCRYFASCPRFCDLRFGVKIKFDNDITRPKNICTRDRVSASRLEECLYGLLLSRNLSRYEVFLSGQGLPNPHLLERMAVSD